MKAAAMGSAGRFWKKHTATIFALHTVSQKMKFYWLKFTGKQMDFNFFVFKAL
jgi:hypothetical protein